jgi:uroporphyrinogen decarboxylase
MPSPPPAGASHLADSPFLAACRRQRPAHTPVWFMRQAGRSLPEYRARRGPGSILDAVRQPELAAELTLQPVRRYGVDAAVLFSDIVVPVAGIGFGVDVAPGTGPVVAQPFASRSDLDRLRPLDPDGDTPYVQQTIKILVGELDVPLIGFAGGPFTVASYLIEGGPSRDYLKTKALMWADPVLFTDLLGRLADIAIASLRAQVGAGASAVQVFDSWAGALALDDYRRLVLPSLARILGETADLGVPRIVFGVGTGELLGTFAQAGAEVVGVDWRVPLAVAAERTGGTVALQGNLDPAACLASWDVLAGQARRVLGEAQGLPGHVFNLGHGVLPATDPDNLARLVDLVHEQHP